VRRAARAASRVLAAAGALALPLWGAAPLAAGALAVSEVAPGVFVHQGPHEDFTPANAGGIANLGFVIGERSVAVVDSGGSRRQGEELLAAVRARTPLPISHVVDTHVHPDHLLGNAAFQGTGAVFVGHAKLAGRLAEAGPFYLANLRRLLGPAFAGTELVPPDEGVAATATIDLGGRTLELRAWPTAHTDTDLTVLDTATGTLFAGDLVFMERIPVVDGSLLGWLAVMDELARIPAERVVPGHGPAQAPWPGAMAAQRRYLEYLRDEVRAALRRNRTLAQAVDEVPPPPGQSWRLAADNHARNVTATFTELEWE
jgi:quinoprotein relay system zinc metallohydrolase 2